MRGTGMGRGGSPAPWSVSVARCHHCIDSMAAKSLHTCRRGRCLVLDTLWHCCLLLLAWAMVACAKSS